MNQFYPPEKFITARVELRKHSIDLAGTMLDYINQDRERLERFLPWVKFSKTLQDEIQYIESTHEKWEKCELFDYGIFERAGQNYIGNVGLHSISWHNARCEIGYWLFGNFEGQGLMTEAVQALTSHFFENGFHRVEIRCSPLNEKSAGVPRRLGFQLEAKLRENAFDGEAYRDTLVFAMLQREWAGRSL